MSQSEEESKNIERSIADAEVVNYSIRSLVKQIGWKGFFGHVIGVMGDSLKENVDSLKDSKEVINGATKKAKKAAINAKETFTKNLENVVEFSQACLGNVKQALKNSDDNDLKEEAANEDMILNKAEEPKAEKIEKTANVNKTETSERTEEEDIREETPKKIRKKHNTIEL